jgi:hypothetical protein
MKIWKNTYHVVLERPMLPLFGAMPCDFIVLINDLIIIIGVM